MRPETLMPMVRAALERGEGPPAVLAWVRANAPLSADETRVRTLAGRLAQTLTLRNDLRTLSAGETLQPRFAN